MLREGGLLSDERESRGKTAAKRKRSGRARELTPAVIPGPRGYVAMHEVNAAMCLAGGILAPRFEKSAARDHHVAAAGIQAESEAPSASSLAGAQGDLPYGNVVVFEVPLPVAGQPTWTSLPLWRANRLVFESQEACDLFRARMSGYGDVPDDVLPMDVDAKLFAARNASVQAPLLAADAAAERVTGATQAIVDPEAGAYSEFRAIDRCAGGLLGATSTLQGSASSLRLLEAMGSLALGAPSRSPVEQFASTIALLADQSHDAPTFVPVLTAVASALSSGTMDEGFSATALLRDAESACCRGVQEDSAQHKAIQKFWVFTKEVLALRREVPAGAWSDEGGSAIARGTLTFMLNPEPEQLQAVRDRTPSLGAAVHFIAGLLVGIRAGLTRMGKEVKSARVPFLAGSAFVHDWLRGQHASLALQRTWDAEGGGRESVLVYEGASIARVKVPADPLRVAIAGSLRAAGIDARFSPDTGGLSGRIGMGGPEATFEVGNVTMPAFPRQQALEAAAIVPLKLARRATEAIVAEVNGGTREHRVSARVVEGPAGRAAVRLSVLMLQPSASEPLNEAMAALVSKASDVASIVSTKAPRRVVAGKDTSHGKGVAEG